MPFNDSVLNPEGLVGHQNYKVRKPWIEFDPKKKKKYGM